MAGVETTGVRCMLMRGGTSKGLFFVRDDLPDSSAERDELLLRLMGSPDNRQIDGLGGAHPLTSKVAVVAKSSDPQADLDYLFLQVSVDEPRVSDRQNCGNMLAGVAPFAIERGLIEPTAARLSTVRIRLLNTGGTATATVRIHEGRVVYDGDTTISGVPGAAAPILLDFDDTAGSSCGTLLPTGNIVDVIDGINVTMIDNGMPVVVMRAIDLEVTGYESPDELEANAGLRTRLESIRIQAGVLMELGDVTDTTVPKLTMVSPPASGGAINTRTFIPHRCHEAIGVLGAVSVATATLLPGSPAATIAEISNPQQIAVEHPTGTFDASIDLRWVDDQPIAQRSGIVRTARKLMDGMAFPRT